MASAPTSDVLDKVAAVRLAAGRPVLMGVRGDVASLVEEPGTGLAFEPESAPSLAAAVERLATMPDRERDELGARGRAFYSQQLSFPRDVESMVQFYLRHYQGAELKENQCP